MARVIEFYVPKNFRKPLNWAPAVALRKDHRVLRTDQEICLARTGQLSRLVDLAERTGRLRGHLNAFRAQEMTECLKTKQAGITATGTTPKQLVNTVKASFATSSGVRQSIPLFATRAELFLLPTN